MGIRRPVEAFAEPNSEALIKVTSRLSHLHNSWQVDRAVHLEEDHSIPVLSDMTVTHGKKMNEILYIIVEKKWKLVGDRSPLV